MRYSPRVNLVGAAISMLSLGVAPIAIAQDISESDIVALIAEMEYHTNQGNVEALVNVIDPEANFGIASEIGIEPALVRIANLETFFANGFEGVESHRVNLAIDDIEIEGSVATVTGTTVDRSVQDGLETISHLSWTNVIERQEDDLKVIQWRSRMTGYSIREVESAGDL
ncbi:MAG: hypothetical protein AB4050_02960 [Synechococcus sp.]